jgi:hypothetical protein
MAFIIDTNKTKKVYFDEKMEVSEKETKDYVEILAEPNIEVVEDIKKAIKPKNLKIARDMSMEMEMSSLGHIPLEIVAKVVKGWSEDEPLNLNTLKTKVHSKLINNLWNEILHEYGLDQQNDIKF